MFCQAVDTIDNTAVNCMHKVTDKVELRASARLPLMILCKFHRKKLNQHTSCPMCGQFCTRGTFVDCTGGKGICITSLAKSKRRMELISARIVERSHSKSLKCEIVSESGRNQAKKRARGWLECASGWCLNPQVLLQRRM
ncbi:hypothetical protein EB796_015711 [Bugula neritina]|uniref:EHMT1/2 cysteine-rich region domain-containing protein n=1 Tax=Bugula neritina TaxID=10212 RepID=A0A7J7JI23_BUGNE|nr:hypothetical protein EB796_015711 [Bugula neritina]